MEKANHSVYSLGSAAYAAKRAADITYILQNKDQADHAILLGRLNKTLKLYGEDSRIVTTDLDELQAVSRRLIAVFGAGSVKIAVSILNDLLSEYVNAPRISAHDETSWHLHIDSSDHAPWAEWFAASSALALATLLTEKQRRPGGLCASPVCSRPFIDLGKGGGRTYCSPRCATRVRVAAYRKKGRSPTV